jgi:Cys-rich repeat protein
MKMNWLLKAGTAYFGLAAAVLLSGANCGSSSTGTSCTSDSDCASGDTCDTSTSECVGPSQGCTADSDCATGDTCDTTTGECVTSAGCTSDSDCAADETCDTTSGTCSFAGCTADADCLAGETCDTTSGLCMGTPTTEPSCQQCACTDILSMGGCANVCKMSLNGTTTPNFCDGVAALPQCAKCLSDNCGGITDPPDPTDPSTCMD